MARTKQFDEVAALKGALEIFWRKGYSATSMEDLVRAMGINRASLYATYGDKHLLFMKALEHYRDESADAMLKSMMQPGKSIQVITDMMNELVEQCVQGPSRKKGCFLSNAAVEMAPHDAEVAKVVEHNLRRMIAALSALVNRGQIEGDIRSDEHADTIAAMLFNTMQGCRVMGKSGAGREMLTGIVNHTIESIRAK